MITKQKLILLISAILVVIPCIIWFTWHQTIDCSSLKTQIQKKIELANYCNIDDDCIIKSFGCPFGCGSYLNKNFNINEILKDIKTFQFCPESQCLYKCRSPVQPKCNNNKCVAPQCEINIPYPRPYECVCPEGTITTYELDKGIGFLICKTK